MKITTDELEAYLILCIKDNTVPDDALMFPEKKFARWGSKWAYQHILEILREGKKHESYRVEQLYHNQLNENGESPITT